MKDVNDKIAGINALIFLAAMVIAMIDMEVEVDVFIKPCIIVGSLINAILFQIRRYDGKVEVPVYVSQIAAFVFMTFICVVESFRSFFNFFAWIGVWVFGSISVGFLLNLVVRVAMTKWIKNNNILDEESE